MSQQKLSRGARVHPWPRAGVGPPLASITASQRHSCGEGFLGQLASGRAKERAARELPGEREGDGQPA